MLPGKVLEVIERYQVHLGRLPKGHGPFDRPPATREAFSHLHGMLDQLRVFVTGDGPDTPPRLEKAMRWLGFIQGALWLNGDFTLDELRDHNRPEERKE